MTDVVSFRTYLADGGGKTTARSVAGWREISVYRDFNDPALLDIWRTLEAQGRSTAFQSLAFLRPLLDGVCRLAQAECHILVVADREGPLAAFPFVRRRTGTVSVLEFADFGLSDYCAPLIANRLDSDDRALWGAIWREVVDSLPKTDALLIEKMPGHFGGRLNPMILLPRVRPMQTATRQVAVDPLWLKTSVAKEAAYQRRKMDRAGRTEFEIVRDASQIDGLMAVMREMRRRRFQARGILDSLEAPGVFEFYAELLRRGCRDGSSVLGVLRFNVKPVALSAGLVHRGRFNGVLTAMDEDMRTFSPGLVSMAALFEWCIEQKIETYDLGLGEQHYKSRFGGEETMLFELAQAKSLKGFWWKIRRDAKAFARSTLTSYPLLAARVSRLRRKSG